VCEVLWCADLNNIGGKAEREDENLACLYGRWDRLKKCQRHHMSLAFAYICAHGNFLSLIGFSCPKLWRSTIRKQCIYFMNTQPQTVPSLALLLAQ